MFWLWFGDHDEFHGEVDFIGSRGTSTLVIILVCLPFPLQSRVIAAVGHHTPWLDPRSCIDSAFLVCS